MNTDTPRTKAAINASGGQWSFELRDCSSELERELTAVTEQRDRLVENLRDIVKSTDPYEMYKTAKRALESA